MDCDEIYMATITFGLHGQFFTPQNISAMMAEMLVLPTMISAGAVAAAGIAPTTGATNRLPQKAPRHHRRDAGSPPAALSR